MSQCTKCQATFTPQPFPEQDEEEGIFSDEVLEHRAGDFIIHIGDLGGNSSELDFLEPMWLKHQQQKWNEMCRKCWLEDKEDGKELAGQIHEQFLERYVRKH